MARCRLVALLRLALAKCGSPLSAVIRTLSGHRPRAEFGPASDIGHPRQRLTVCKVVPIPLTTRRQFDILQAGPGWQATNAIRSIEKTRVYHGSRHERLDPGRI